MCNSRSVFYRIGNFHLAIMFKLVKRQQRIKELLESMPDHSTHSKHKLHIIDRAYRHPQFSQLGPAQKEILNLTLNELIEGEKKRIVNKQHEEQRVDCDQVHKKLQNFVYSQTPIKSLHLQSSPQLSPNIHQLEQNRVYIERKYNHKLCYQLHAIMQATNIEQHVNTIKNQMATRASHSPLITHLQRHTHTDIEIYSGSATSTPGLSKTKRNAQKSQRPNRKQNNFVQTCRNPVSKPNLLSDDYVKPTVPNQSNALKKYTSTFYVTDFRSSPKK